MTPAAIMTAVVLTAAMLLSCGKGGDKTVAPAATPSDRVVLLEAGDTCLYLDEVLSRIPVDIDAADSAKLFNRIVESWVESQLVNEIAAQYVGDMGRIDRMVEAYRTQLILAEYRKHMKRGERHAVSEDSVRGYYDAHSDELVAEVPLIKGIYVKLPDEAAADGSVEKMLSGVSAQSVRKIEKRLVRDAIQYENFLDRWVDWQTISDQIPYRFFDADAFLESTKDFATTYNGATYLLHVTDYLPSGSAMPYEFAASRIRETMTKRIDADYERRLLDKLYKDAIREGKLRKVSYDPVARKMIEKK